MDIAALPSASPSALPSVQAPPRLEGVSKWMDQYRSDQRRFDAMLQDPKSVRGMDSADMLQLQALTQRFSLQTDLAARLADRFQNTARQILQSGG